MSAEWTGATFTELARLRGVRLLATGSGPSTVVVVPGMEGSGESCLHLVLPVVLDEPSLGRVLLVDYADERHRLLGELVDTITSLVNKAGAASVVWWGQSYGNLLVARACQQAEASIDRMILVSPFTGLPAPLVMAARATLPFTPRALYARTAGVGGRLLFGPAPGSAGRPFFRALAAMRPADVRRRLGWLAGENFANSYLALKAPTAVWLGERDRLIDLPSQQAFFTALTRRPGDRLTMVAGSGHVVLPRLAVENARESLRSWLTG